MNSLINLVNPVACRMDSNAIERLALQVHIQELNNKIADLQGALVNVNRIQDELDRATHHLATEKKMFRTPGVGDEVFVRRNFTNNYQWRAGDRCKVTSLTVYNGMADVRANVEAERNESGDDQVITRTDCIPLEYLEGM